jgi:hypothetical protein
MCAFAQKTALGHFVVPSVCVALRITSNTIKFANLDGRFLKQKMFTAPHKV